LIKNKKIIGLTFLYIPPSLGGYGGLYRFIQILNRICSFNLKFIIILNKSEWKAGSNDKKNTYVYINNFFSKYESSFKIRIISSILRILLFTINGLRLSSYISFVYVPSSEMLDLLIPAYIVSKIRKKSLICVFQLPPPGMISKNFSSTYNLYRRSGIGIINSILANFYALLGRILAISIANHSDAVIAVSNSLANDLKVLGLKKRIYVVPAPLSFEKYPLKRSKKIKAIFVGRHTPEKGIIELLFVWRKIISQLPEAILVMIGSCTHEMDKLIAHQIKQLKLNNNVHRLGVVSREKLFSEIQEAKLLIHLSHLESQSYIIKEALSLGTPVVCYDIPAIREFYPYKSVIRVPEGDLEAVYDEVLKLLRSEETPIYHTIIQDRNWDDVSKEEYHIIKLVLNKGVKNGNY
jgi:glycosyltransferase involved in cell wall biosynthesis